MSLYQNAQEAQNAISEFLEANPFHFSLKLKAFQKDLSLTILSEPLYNGQFNRVLRTKTSYTFSFLSPDKMTEYKKKLIKNSDQLKTNSKTFEIKDNAKDLETSLIAKPRLNDTFLQSIFSIPFIEKNTLTPDEIESKLKISRALQEDKIRNSEPVSHLRWEEIRDNLRVILSISPIDGAMQLSYCFLYSDYQRGYLLQNYNPVTAHFVERFRYAGARFDRFTSNHIVHFSEIQGYKFYPENDLNEQSFEIKFNAISEGAFDEIAQKSFRSLKRETKPILSFLHLVYANDSFGNTRSQLPLEVAANNQSELHEIMHRTLGNSLNSNQATIGTLHYHSPENDIYITYSPTLELDDSGNEFIVFSVQFKVIPFNSMPPPSKGMFIHPVIYDALK